MDLLGKFLGQFSRDREDRDDEDNYYLDDDYYDNDNVDDGDYDNYDEDEEPEQSRGGFFANMRRAASRSDRNEDERQEARSEGVFSKRNKVVRMQQAPSTMEVTMKRPRVFNDAKDICDDLLDGKAVVINLEGLDERTAQRITDFTFGVLASINGDVQKISTFVLIASPQNISLSGDFKGDFSKGYMGSEQPAQRAVGAFGY